MSEEKSLEVRVSELEAEVADLKKRVTKLENGEAINDLRSRLKSLEARVEKLGRK